MIWGMVIDLKLCIGCQACSLACKTEYGIPRGMYWTKTLIDEVGVYPNVTRVYLPQLCNHCEEAPCEKTCPTGASYTDEATGVVLGGLHEVHGLPGLLRGLSLPEPSLREARRSAGLFPREGFDAV